MRYGGDVMCLLAIVVGSACSRAPEVDPASNMRVFTNLRLIDGTGAAPIDNALLVVSGGRIDAAGSSAAITVPADAEHVDLGGATVVPGLINAHGHVGTAAGLESGPEADTRENVLDQLALYARYGVTTVVSLGDGAAARAVRDEQRSDSLAGDPVARLYVAGPVLTPETPEEARASVADAAANGVDWVKIRVDDNLGQGRAMTPEVYAAVAAAADEHGLPLAAHIVKLDDAKGVLRAGADLIAHSVRDAPVDAELIRELRDRNVCYVPTLTREVSTFVYESRPDFFDDPFFIAEADTSVMRGLLEPSRQEAARSPSAAWYRAQLPQAQANVKALADAGVRIAFGTDTGPAGRFQGYFEHMEASLLAESGLTPEQVLLAATRDAAACMHLPDLGTLEPGKLADFVVLSEDPLTDVSNLRSIRSVWIGGREVPRPR